MYASISSEILRIARTTTDLANMVTWINLFLIRMKKLGSEWVCIIPLFKNILGKHCKVFHKFPYGTIDFSELFPLYLIYLCAHASTFSCKIISVICIHMCFMCVIYNLVCICCSAFVFLVDTDISFAKYFTL